MKKKVLFIAPHLSTGGMPQYLVKQIELIKDDCEVYCVEWGDVTGGVLVVQRNKMIKLLGDRLITLGEDKNELFKWIDRIKPDTIHLQEIPELFMEAYVADKLYSTNREYTLIETSHDSGYDTKTKVYLPDKFLMVSQYQASMYKDFDIPCDVVEYPIENKIRTKTREQALTELGLDPNLKHVINVGLFTPRKNQAEVIEYARMLQGYPIQFHFIGNQADNFQFYWGPLMKDFPSNCKWWNERSDVDNFYEAADLFLFTSRGSTTDHETMPLVIRESLGWKVPSLIYNLPVYMGYFDKYDTIEYLTEDLQKNAYKIAEKLLREDNSPHKLILQTIDGEKEFLNITYLNSTVDNIASYGEPAAQYFSTFLLKELEMQSVSIEKGDVFVDLGANMGMTALYAAHKGASEIHCFEPDPSMINLIKHNVPNVITHRYAVGVKNETLELYHWPFHPMNPGPKYTCDSITLSDVIKIVKKKIDFLKVDIEGFEDGLFDSISYEEASQINKIIVEVHDINKIQTLHDTLYNLGFDIIFTMYGAGQAHVYAKRNQTIVNTTNNENKEERVKKEIFILSTYPDMEGKEKLLNDTVKKLKSLGKDVLIASHYPVPDYIVKKADYYLYDSKNVLDTSRTLQTNGPDYWLNETNFRTESVIVKHIPALSRLFSISMDFVQSLGYEYFVLLESDAIYDINDLRQFDSIRTSTLEKQRRIFFFKPLPAEFTWMDSQVYETYCFGGMISDFIDLFKFPKDLEGWTNITKNMGQTCMEYVIYKVFSPYENELHIINGTIKKEFRSSKIDLYSQSDSSGVFYNLNDELAPILFLHNHKDDQVEFKFNNGSRFNKITLNKFMWYFEPLDLKNLDNLSVKIEKYVNGELQSSVEEIVSRDTIQNKKLYKTIKFNS
jgi:FkbM family methyltransferase